MTLPTTGPLSLSQIQTEFGGANPISLSEYYAGGAYVPSGTSGTNGAVPSSGTISIWNFYGTSNVITETQTVTVGSFIFKGSSNYGFQDGLYGSISDGTFGFISNAPIIYFSWSNSNQLFFRLSGNRANSGWTKVTISGVDFTRAAATYSYNAGSNYSQWLWSTGTNVFGTTTGATKPCVFTQ
mgnify:CR=1 FL=1